MWLTDLADVLRDASLDRVVEVDGWKTRGHGPMTSVDGIVAHHTAGPETGDYPSLGTVRDGIPDRPGRRGLPGPLAQIGVGRSGRVWVIAAGLSYHAGAVRAPSFTNSRRIGIEAEATGRDGVATDWPAAQMFAYVRVCAALAVAYRFPSAQVLGHKEVCSPVGRKIDPHPVDMDAFRRLVDRDITLLQRPQVPPVAPPADRPVLSRGTRGSAVKTLQGRLDALGWDDPGPNDGVFDARVERAVIGVQVAAGIIADGVVGPRTWTVLDAGRRPRFVLDEVLARGDRGAAVTAVQRALTGLGIPTAVDGVFGPQTERSVRRRQAVRDLDVDGRVGRDTAAALGGVSR